MEQENALQIWFVVCSQNYNKPKIKMKKEKQKKETKAIAILQIFILVIATIAFSWIVGSSIETVSASDGSCGIGGTCEPMDGCAAADIILGSCDKGEVCCRHSGGSSGNDERVDNKEISKLAEEGKKYGLELVKRAVEKKIIEGVTEKIVKKKVVEEGIKEKGVKKILKKLFRPKTGGTGKGFFKDWTIMGTGDSTGIGAMAGDFVAAVGWAAVAFAVVWGITELMGASKRNQADILTAAGVGGVIGIVLVTVNLLAVPWAAGFVLGAALLWGVLSYQNYAQEVYTYRVKLWQPPSGGAECSKCNLLKVGTGKNQVSGCSEYICRSYGASCEWINDESQYETCIEVNKGDISPPVITPAREINGEPVFKDNKFRYDISAAGARIVYEGEGGGAAGCIPTYTPIKLAFTTNEEAHCKISLEPKAGTAAEAFDAMNDYLNEQNLKTKNHTLQIPSSVFADEKSFENAGYILNNGGKYNFYVRCKDQRGNINTQDYEIRICVQKGLNTNPPKIVGTNPAKDSFIPFNVSVIENFQVYTDRPADCKWDIKEASYNYMSYDFDKCSQNINEYLVGFDYGCQTNLTGFKDGVENKYYVACKNYPEFKGNPEKESKRTPSRPYEIVLKGTNKLVIQSVRINDRANGTTIIGREENAKIELSVVTVGGAEEGKSRCLYSENQATPTYSLFSNGRSREYLNTNFEEFYMPQGFYEYLIKCYDSAENTATTLINFTVEVDLLSPMVVRAFKDDSSNSLKIITDESARCVYSTTSCNYNIEEGNELSTENGKEHYIEWNPEIDLYVKCIDDYHNYPNEGECSIVVRPFEMMGAI